MKCVLNCLKVHGPIFQTKIVCLLKSLSLQRSQFHIPAKSITPFTLDVLSNFSLVELPIPCCLSLIMVTIIGHVFTNIL